MLFRSAEAHGRQANFLPRVDLRASNGIAYNENGITGRRDEQVIELVLNYNLFKGGSDQALSRQYVERLKQSKDLRDKTCRDIRQTLNIAYNDIQNLTRQLGFLDQHQLSIEKAREAYRKQYDIGQRTLLDLLDTENEYFQAQRAYTNATYEHAIAYIRTQAGLGNLLTALQVGREGLPTAKDLGQDRLDVDADSQCPAVAPLIPTSQANQTPRISAVMPTLPTPPSKPAPAAAPSESLSQQLLGWAAAWSAKDLAHYKSYYAKSFTPEKGRSIDQWVIESQARLNKPGEIKIAISEFKTTPLDADKATTEFKQTYNHGKYHDVVIKRLEWVREGNRWKIQREQVLTTIEAVYS